MSRYIDINQLLEEIGTSARSASDPWTLSRGYHGLINHDSFQPSVVADLGAPIPELNSEVRSAEQIANANVIAPGPTSGTTSTNSSGGAGWLGGLLNFFPLASGIAKLFGLGDSSSPPALTPYVAPPSINFEGATSGPGSGITSLSYGSDGLPRTSSTRPEAASSSSKTSVLPAAASDPIGQLTALAMANPSSASSTAGGSNVVSQLMTLSGAAVATDASGTNTIFHAGLPSTPGIPNSEAGSMSPLQNAAGATPFAQAGTMPGTPQASTTGSQQGQSILVQVQAMDSQSFMDHSQEIAQAVRQAMLNMNSLNDTILDL